VRASATRYGVIRQLRRIEPAGYAFGIAMVQTLHLRNVIPVTPITPRGDGL